MMFFKKLFFSTLLVIVMVCMLGCLSVKNIKFTDMDLSVDTSGSILKLRNYGDVNLDLLGQSENLVLDALVLKYGEEYGYYAIDYGAKEHKYTGWSVLSGIIGFFPMFPTVFLGLPFNYVRFYLDANLYIFDSEGNLVKMYTEKRNFVRAEGIYYGHNPTATIAKQYSKLFEVIFKKANAESRIINNELKKRGVLTEQKRDVAMSKIREFFATHHKENSKISNLPIQ